MNITNACHKSNRKCPWKVLVLCLLAAAAAALLLLETVWAQEGTEYEYVDLVMGYEYDEHQVVYSVQNVGTATATGVTVSFLLEDLEVSPSEVGSLRIANNRTENSTNQRFTWDAGTVLPRESSKILKFSTSNHSGHSTSDRIGVITATASSNQLEPDFLQANNVAKVYSFASSTTGATQHMSNNNLALLLTVDDLEPDAGDDLNFDLTARNRNPGRGGSRRRLHRPHRRYRDQGGIIRRTGVQIRLDPAHWICDHRPVGNLEACGSGHQE